MEETKVFYFIPNIIGYIRIILACIAFWQYNSPFLFFFCYALSEFLDAVDGYAARLFHQSSTYGAVLDMVTDRCSTSALLVVLAKFYPAWMNLFNLIIAIDITSHYAHLYSSLSRGKTHKQVDANTNYFIRLYYGNRNVLFTLCAANEAMFLALYLYNFYPNYWVIIFLIIVLPGGLFKQFMNVWQMIQAFQEMAETDQVVYAKRLAELKLAEAKKN